jgi:endonuclease YncB( thermonuclease family)
VLSVLEGDLLSVVRDGRAVKLRLLDADCPETTRPFGDRATAQTSRLVLGKPVTVSGFTDVKGQLVGKVSFQYLAELAKKAPAWQGLSKEQRDIEQLKLKRHILGN